MSATQEEIELLEKKLALLRQIKDLESSINTTPKNQSALSGPNPEQMEAEARARREAMEKAALSQLTPEEAMIVLLKRKGLNGPFRGDES